LLIGTNTGLLYCRLNEPGIIEIVRAISEIPESKITCIQKMRNQPGFFISTENDGVFRLYFKDRLFKVQKITADPDFDFSGVQDICEDSQSNLWLGSFGNGLVKLTSPSNGTSMKINRFNINNDYVSDNVKTVFEDREGNIWSGNYGEGLTQVTPKVFSVSSFDKSLYGSDIFSICLTNSFKWIGTEKGLVKINQLTGSIVKFFGPGSELPKDTVTAIYSADGINLWIGTEKNGLFKMDIVNEKIDRYPIGVGALENSITIITGRGEQVWIGTKKGICNINSGTNRTKWYTINQGGLPHNFINCLYLDRKDRLWVSTHSKTLAYILGEKVFKISLNSASGIVTLGPITEDTDSRIWVGTTGDGVFMMESDSIANITVKEGLLNNYCYSIICDDHKNIWVGHKGGLSKIRTTDFLVKPIQHIKNTTDSYQFNPNAIIKDEQERIWFGSDKGMVSYNPSMEYTRLLPPVLGITSLKINGEAKDWTDKIILTPGNYKIRIDFLGISLKEQSLVTYQYKLEGFDQLTEVTKNTFITYNNLKEGNYKFILNASSGDGAVTENPLIISIIINKPLWKKWWFYLITVIILFITIFIYIKRRIHRLLVEKKVLEEKVLERTREIQFQKHEIELQSDIINEKNANITSSIKYASHIQHAVLPPVEFIDRLLPHNFILSIPKDIVSGDFYWLAEKDNKIVFTVADCTGHGVPGAFMSLLGITLLNEIVNIQGITKSDTIVTKLRERVIHSLQQSRKEIPTSDGMDISLCVLDKNLKRIQYTGGMSDLVFIRDKRLEVVKSDRLSVCVLGGYKSTFTMKEFDYKEGDVFYLFSDGFQDQFGGDLDKKYLRRRFYCTLLEIHELPMPEQREALEKRFNEWMKDYIQTDDITVMGIRL
jgi:serine phosphatase RsbU (regulator of sigma subunit)/streptogramin lyase